MGISASPPLSAEIERILLTADQLQERVAALGAEITEVYQGRELLLVGVLQGSLVFMSDLMRQLPGPVRIDCVAARSYGVSAVSSGQLEILKDLDTAVGGLDVLIIEDIVDSGRTLSTLREALSARQPASLRICSLLDKPARREVTVPLDFVGFTIPDEFVVGYGLDYAGLYRNLPFVGILSRWVYESSQD